MDGAERIVSDAPRRSEPVASVAHPVIGRQLRVGAVDDPAERHADRMAEDVLRMVSGSRPPVVAHGPGVSSRIRRRSDGDPIGTALRAGGVLPAAVQRVMRASTGRPLADQVRAPLEGAFDADLGSVRIHDGDAADAASRAIGARAFAVGADVYFRAGAFRPSGEDGRRLLAHELAHVVQSGGAPVIRREWDSDDAIGEIDGLAVYRWLEEWEEWYLAADEQGAGIYWRLDDDGEDFTGECYMVVGAGSKMALKQTRPPRSVKLRQPRAREEASRALTMGGGGQAKSGGGGFGRFEKKQSTDKYSAMMYSPSGEFSPTREQALYQQFGTVPQYRPFQDWGTPTGDRTPPWVQTPGGTQLDHRSSYGRLKLYSNRPQQRTDVVRGNTPVPITSGNLPPAPATGQKTVIATVTAQQIRNWSGRKRSRQQAAVMGNVSAESAARAIGLASSTGRGWEWLHLISHGMGGPDPVGGFVLNSGGRTPERDPQVPGNLVAGTEESNTEMIVVEETVKDLLFSGECDAVEIMATATLITGTHVATSIEYLVTGKKRGSTIGAKGFQFKPQTHYRPLAVEQKLSMMAGPAQFWPTQ